MFGDKIEKAGEVSGCDEKNMRKTILSVQTMRPQGNSLYAHGSWETPLGEVKIDEEAAESQAVCNERA